MITETFKVRDAMGRETWVEREMADVDRMDDHELSDYFRAANPEPVDPTALETLRQTLEATR